MTRPCSTMVQEQWSSDTIDLARRASGGDQARVIHKPWLLTDIGSSYVAADLADDLDACGIEHVRGASHHPPT